MDNPRANHNLNRHHLQQKTLGEIPRVQLRHADVDANQGGVYIACRAEQYVEACGEVRGRGWRSRIGLGVNQVELSASSTEIGSAKGKVDCITTGVDQYNFAIGLNATYLEEFLAAIGKEAPFTASFKESQSAVMFEVPHFKYVVMPMGI